MNFMGFDARYEDADVVFLGAPYDGTVSFRPGARFGPDYMRRDSYALETYSPYQDRDLSEGHISDIGDMELPIGNREKCLDMIHENILNIIADGKKPLLAGGEHLISLPAVKAVSSIYKDLVIIHLDAHTDLRDDYLGEKLSHSTVMRRIYEIVGEKNIYQFGIRSGLREEFKFSRDHCNLEPYTIDSLKDMGMVLNGRPVYLSIDLDVLDPSVFPGTGTPEPGGITFKELLSGIISLRGLNIVGADVVELSPEHDTSSVSTLCGAKVIREVSLLMSLL